MDICISHQTLCVLYVPYLWLIPTKDLQNVKMHKPLKAVLKQTPDDCNREVAGFRLLAMYLYYKLFESVKVVFVPNVPRCRRQHCYEKRCFGFSRLTFR